ncbi:MAG: C40 family peptidase [Alphaproteobacteria bacterium]|nr:C40 family peptidase [Alphaproteobacteria bacterium]
MRYDALSYPGSSVARDGFANCQSFSYAVLRHFGHVVPDIRSSELWADRVYTFHPAREWEALDLIFVNSKRSAFGAHLGVYLGNEMVLHLSKRVGHPAVWSLDDFAACRSYRVLIGAKRCDTHVNARVSYRFLTECPH